LRKEAFADLTLDNRPLNTRMLGNGDAEA